MYRLKFMLRVTLSLCITLSIVLFLFIQTSYAHAYSASYTILQLTKSQTLMTYSLDELSVIELTNGDTNHNGMLEQEEFEAVKDQLIGMLKDNITFKLDGVTTAWTSVESVWLDRKGDATKMYLNVIYPAMLASQPISLIDNLYLHDTQTNYVNLLTINYGSQKSTAALSGNNRLWAIQLSEEDYAGLKQEAQLPRNMENVNQVQDNGLEESSSISGWYSFFKLGMNHILTGYDHLLFLLSLLIARQTFKQYALVITSFTIAHSLTLTLTVLGWIDISPRLIEPAIALSICYVAIDNIIRKNVSLRWVITFFFGLIHGMGFADIMKEMDIPKTQLAVDLASFNIGIEVVQLTIVIVLLPLLGILHRWKFSRRAVISGSSLALVLGVFWLAERIIYA